jgi:ATP-dependent RNA helicase DeaD
MITFKELGLRDEILKVLEEIGFETPTPIQEQTINLLINSDKDLIGLAQTGTGKTAAFSLPILNNIVASNNVVQAIILCPTRELCLQIERDITTFSKYLPKITSLAVYGGTSITNQINALKHDNIQIVVGTPGRTLDLINRKRLDISNIKWLILDEADEMLSMGFKDELDAILANAPAEEKQTLLFSATMPKEIKRIANKYMTNADEVSAGQVNVSNKNILHKYFIVNARDRYVALKRLADFYPGIYSIVFCRTKAETQDVANKLAHDGYNADALHGDLSQAQRDYVMNRFRKKQLQMLVATDVAARGLDVENITHVINYNLPDDPEVYIHRSGRTGRAGKEGVCYSLIHSREMGKIRVLERKIGKEVERELVPSGKEICAAQLWNLIDKVKTVEVNEKQIEAFLPEIYERLEEIDHKELIKRFVSVEFNRFLEYYQGAVDINITKTVRDRGDKNDRSESRGSGDSKFTKFSINHGKKSKLTPKMLIGLINEHTEGHSIDIGRIDIQFTESFFDIDSQYTDVLIKAFKESPYEDLKVEVAKGGGGSSSFGGERRGGSGGRGGERRGGGERRSRRGDGRDRGGSSGSRPTNRRKRRD